MLMRSLVGFSSNYLLNFVHVYCIAHYYLATSRQLMPRYHVLIVLPINIITEEEAAMEVLGLWAHHPLQQTADGQTEVTVVGTAVAAAVTVAAGTLHCVI
jgi:hypothetical protein